LNPGEVHLWRLDLEPGKARSPELERSLAEDERARAERLHNADGRARFILTRSCLRLILGWYSGQAPHQIRFAYQENGKPFLETDTDVQLQFNLSHAHHLGLFAVCRNLAVGVDVEYMQPGRDIIKVARRFFSPGEVATIEALPAHRQEAACYQLWTCKEALLKACGAGLATGLDRVEVRIHPGGPPQVLMDPEEETGWENWRLSLLDPGPGYCGAVATEKKAGHFQYFRFSM
jgi:4'-phosphopantetheinyl transferase